MPPQLVVTLDGRETGQDFDGAKVRRFLGRLSSNLDQSHLDIDTIVLKVEAGLPLQFTKEQLYDLVAETLAANVIYHPDYSLLAGRVEAIRIQHTAAPAFSDAVELLYNYRNHDSKRSNGLVSRDFRATVINNKAFFNDLITPARDFDLSYFGIKTLQKSYLLHMDGVVAETPQYLFMRVAIGIHGDNIQDAAETYRLMSERYFIHASPTLFNAGTEYSYLSSCFLLAMKDDSIDGIYKTLHEAALISKASGGIGLHVHNIRSSGAYIATTNGTSSGLVPMLRVFNDTARYVDQGGNKRPGAFAVYIEPWHADIFNVLDLKKNHGKEELRARDLFFGLWIPDLFMERVKKNLDWSLFSPDDAPGLADCFGQEFVDKYEAYERDGTRKTTISAQKLWLAILESQTETGGPYMLYKDACNSKSNQQNLGTIKSSNLCCEIVEYSSPEETAVCNLGSLALPSFIKSDNDSVLFDFDKLHSVTKTLTKNLNRIIDVTCYPTPSTEKSNLNHRPIAIGVQGLADLFCELRLPFDSSRAKTLNIQIFETIYHAAVETSIELAIKDGTYSSFEGSPASKGKLQFDLWNHKPSPLYDDWDKLKSDVSIYGLRNSLLVAPMPTASTSQILGFNECFEPFTSNIYNRRVLSGEYQIVNKYLLRDLIDLNLWSKALKDRIILEGGSIQNIPGIPQELKEIYKTVWEISQKVIVDMAADRGKFIDQLQSMNIHIRNPTFGKLTSCHFYAWERGLKTGMYYLRTQAASRAIQFTIDADLANTLENKVDTSKPLKRKRYNETTVVSLKKPKPTKQCFTPESQSLSPEIKRDIYDTTPVACDINEPNNCDSCSA